MKADIIIGKIIKHCDKILLYSKDYSYDTFVENNMVVEACVFNLSQIGEIANHLSREYMDCHEDIPWRNIYGLRNRIVHDYDGVNLELIWEIIQEDIPALKKQLKELLYKVESEC